MAKHPIDDMSLQDGFDFHDITGYSTSEFSKVAMFKQLEIIASAILNTSLSEVYDIITDGIERNDDMDEDFVSIVERFFQDAFSLQPEAYDPDAVDREAVRTKAYELVKKSQLGVVPDDYWKCIACIVWTWKKKDEMSFEEYLKQTSRSQAEEDFQMLVLEYQGVNIPEDEGDSPLEDISQTE